MPDPSELVAASAVDPRPMRMLWRDRIPAGMLSLIAGPPGLGKSSLVALLVADLTRRGLSVLLSNAEDDLHAVTVPRLAVAGAILERVQLVPPDLAAVLPAEFASLRRWMRDTEADAVILDPIAAHFRPERRVHDRSSLRQLANLARTTGAAMLGVHHTTKGFEVGGPNSGLLGTSRAVYVYGYDPEDEDRRALSCVKANGFDAPPALVLDHETVELDGIEAGRLRVIGESGAKAQRKRGRRHEKRDADAHEWLSLYLAAGDDCAQPVRDVKAEGETAGFGWETLRRAKVKLEVEMVRLHGRGERGGLRVWRLPDEHPLRQAPEPEPEPAADGE